MEKVPGRREERWVRKRGGGAEGLRRSIDGKTHDVSERIDCRGHCIKDAGFTNERNQVGEGYCVFFFMKQLARSLFQEDRYFVGRRNGNRIERDKIFIEGVPYF